MTTNSKACKAMPWVETILGTLWITLVVAAYIAGIIAATVFSEPESAAGAVATILGAPVMALLGATPFVIYSERTSK